MFSAGIDRLSSFINRVSVRGWGWHRGASGGLGGVGKEGGNEGGMGSKKGCAESAQHQSYVLSLYHITGRVVRYLLARMGVSVKTFDFRGEKVRPSHLLNFVALTRTLFLLLYACHCDDSHCLYMLLSSIK